MEQTRPTLHEEISDMVYSHTAFDLSEKKRDNLIAELETLFYDFANENYYPKPMSKITILKNGTDNKGEG